MLAFVFSKSETIEYGGAFCVMYGCCGEGAFLFFFCQDSSDTSLPFPERNLFAIGWAVCLLADPEPSAIFALFASVFDEGFASFAHSPSGGAISSLNVVVSQVVVVGCLTFTSHEYCHLRHLAVSGLRIVRRDIVWG
jgi:hypothetical protein